MTEQTFKLIINKGKTEGFEVKCLDKKNFLRETSTLIKEPKKIFLGLGDFLEIGDYNQLLDSVFYSRGSVVFENTLDKINRIISDVGDVPASFLKLAVYYPDFLLKNVPTFCVSVIGRKSRIFPGAATFVKYIKEYDPLILTAMPFEISIEFTKRVGLTAKNLISTEYKTIKNEKGRDVFAGDIKRFISGNRKSLEIGKIMNSMGIEEDEVLYIGRGEAGAKTFSAVNSIAFNPSEQIIPESRISLYGSSLESLLVLFNFGGELEKYLISEKSEEYLPSLVVYSKGKGKSQELIDIELEHRHKQNNIIGQRIEYSEDSYSSVEREIEIEFGGSNIDINEVKELVFERMESFKDSPQELVNKIYSISKDRYRSFCTFK